MSTIYNNGTEYGGGGGGGHTILDSNGNTLPSKSKLQFLGGLVENISDKTVVYLWNATLQITTPSSELYSKVITIKKDNVTVGTTSFSNQGTASFYVHEPGTYQCYCEGYVSNDIVVTVETTYSVTIQAGLDLSAWITAGSTTDYPLNPSSYADFSALEADEAAVRQLMLVHDAVDYLATASAGDSLMQSVINSDICAKWINISDYALDTLYANSDIADEMDTADKYGYGEWGIVDSTTTPPTWGALGCVPIMTANNAPYGNVTPSTTHSSNYAWYAFDGNDNTEWVASGDSSPSMTYEFVNPIQPKKFKLRTRKVASGNTYINSVILYGSNDGSTFEPLTDSQDASSETAGTYEKEFNVSHEGYYKYLKLGITGGTYPSLYTLQFYGREMSVSVPTMTSNTAPYGVASASTEYPDSYAWKAFDRNSENGWAPNDGATNNHVQYEFEKPVKVNHVFLTYTLGIPSGSSSSQRVFTIKGSNDGFTSDSHDLGTITIGASSSSITANIGMNFQNDDEYKYYQLFCADAMINTGTWWMRIDILNFYGYDYSEKEFATGSTAKWIYDHGVELETITSSTSGTGQSVEKRPNCLYGYKSSNNGAFNIYPVNAIDFTDFNVMCSKTGNIVVGNGFSMNIYDKMPNPTNYNVAKTDITPPITSLPVSSVNGNNAPIIYGGANDSTVRRMTITEWWLE